MAAPEQSRWLVLVKHSLPQIEPEQPAAQWRLSPEGRQRAFALADSLAPWAVSAWYTSREPKARETGEIVAARLHLACQPADDLHEHVREGEPFDEPERFAARVAEFFDQPDEIVFGRESAAQAAARFTRAVDRLLVQQPLASLGVIAHGTVISLLLGQRCQTPFFPTWKRLGLPSYAVIRLPQFQLETIVESL